MSIIIASGSSSSVSPLSGSLPSILSTPSTPSTPSLISEPIDELKLQANFIGIFKNKIYWQGMGENLFINQNIFSGSIVNGKMGYGQLKNKQNQVIYNGNFINDQLSTGICTRLNANNPCFKLGKSSILQKISHESHKSMFRYVSNEYTYYLSGQINNGEFTHGIITIETPDNDMIYCGEYSEHLNTHTNGKFTNLYIGSNYFYTGPLIKPNELSDSSAFLVDIKNQKVFRGIMKYSFNYGRYTLECWTGQCINYIANFSFNPNKSEKYAYTGSMLNSKHVKGTLYDTDLNVVYVGEFNNGPSNGNCYNLLLCNIGNPCLYKLDNEVHGISTDKYNTEGMYTGKLTNGQQFGTGELTQLGKTIFKGTFKNGMVSNGIINDLRLITRHPLLGGFNILSLTGTVVHNIIYDLTTSIKYKILSNSQREIYAISYSDVMFKWYFGRALKSNVKKLTNKWNVIEIEIISDNDTPLTSPISLKKREMKIEQQESQMKKIRIV